MDPYGGQVMHEKTGRSGFRLHLPGRSRGCITAGTSDEEGQSGVGGKSKTGKQDEKDWDKVKKIIDDTKTSTYDDNLGVKNKIKSMTGNPTQIKKFGYLIVK